jgi:hypothetical protein
MNGKHRAKVKRVSSSLVLSTDSILNVLHDGTPTDAERCDLQSTLLPERPLSVASRDVMHS